MQANIFRYKHKLARTAFCFALLLGLSAALLPRAYAQTATDRKFSKNHGIAVNNALQALNSDDYETALNILDKTLEDHPDLNPYEKSIVFQMKGQAHYALKEVPRAIKAFTQAIDAGGMTKNENCQLHLNTGQLLIAIDKGKRAARLLKSWEYCGSKLNSHDLEFVIKEGVHSKDYTGTLPWAERWFNEAAPKERKHYDLLNFLYKKSASLDKQKNLLKEMLNLWPEDKTVRYNWISHLEKNGQEKDAFEANKIAYLMGGSTPYRYTIKLIQDYSFYDMPLDAARTLEHGIATGCIAENDRYLIWLSVLYEDAKEDNAAHAAFQRAIKISDEKSAQLIRTDIRRTKQPYPPPPVFKPVKIDKVFTTARRTDRDAQPLVRIPPVIPKQAKLSGHCKVRFNVTKDGVPSFIKIIYCTEHILEAPSIQSVEKWKYNPKIINGEQVPRAGVETKIYFKVKDKEGNLIPEISP